MVATQLDVNTRLSGILLRKLPRSIGHDSLTTMLLFAQGLLAVDFIDSSPGDAGFATAIAQFETLQGAQEAQSNLNNKLNATKDANMIVEAFVEALASSSLGRRINMRRSIVDNALSRQQTNASNVSPGAGSAGDGLSRQTSRYAAGLAPGEQRISPHISPPGPELPAPDSHNRFDTLFSPHSPVSNRVPDRAQNSGKAFINDDAVDDETGELLKDPLAYVRGSHRPAYTTDRRQLDQSGSALSHFGSLSLGASAYQDGSGHGSAAVSNMPTPLTAPHNVQAANRNAYRTSPQQLSFPTANPADQNPPCNTLYVGNLPLDTNEDELKRIFCQQRGYKRLSFRMKQNGPMCFVEFENITFATQALSTLYGTLLSNSVKGGMRLSFSKNPLGVRSGQNTMLGSSPLGPPGMLGYGNGISPPPGFSPSGMPVNYDNHRHSGYPHSGQSDGGHLAYGGPSYFDAAFPNFQPQMHMQPPGGQYLPQGGPSNDEMWRMNAGHGYNSR